jgi:putative transposase
VNDSHVRFGLAGGVQKAEGIAAVGVHHERLWRSVKCVDVYVKGYETVPELDVGLHDYFQFYNANRPHQSLGYRTPAEVHFA